MDQNDSLGPKELLHEHLKEYGEEVNKLAFDLYDYLSKDKMDESKELIDQFYDEYYHTSVDESEIEMDYEFEESSSEQPKDVQSTFKEVSE